MRHRLVEAPTASFEAKAGLLAPPEKAPARALARRPEPRASRRARRRAGCRLAALWRRSRSSRVVALVEGFFAYRSSRTAWVFDTPDAQKRHQLRNSRTGEYSFGK